MTLPPGGSPALQSGGHNQKWPTSGSSGYITLAAWRVPNALGWGTKSELAHHWSIPNGPKTTWEKKNFNSNLASALGLGQELGVGSEKDTCTAPCVFTSPCPEFVHF